VFEESRVEKMAWLGGACNIKVDQTRTSPSSTSTT
jgi:hypothetical protein